MKTLNAILKVLTALAAVAGAIYIVATYGEQIVAWAKKVLSSLPKCPCCEKTEPEAPAAEEAAPAEEVTADEEEAPEEAPAVEAPAEEPAPEVVVAENDPVAEDTDFAE